jgi:hypothetical protein
VTDGYGGVMINRGSPKYSEQEQPSVRKNQISAQWHDLSVECAEMNTHNELIHFKKWIE